jgi:hypothetical protein
VRRSGDRTLREKSSTFFYDERAQSAAGEREALERYIAARKLPPHFSNARSIRDALDRARLRHANRIVRSAGGTKITADDLMTIGAPDLLASRVFGQ